MTTLNFTLAPQLHGRRERAPFVPSLRFTSQEARSARHAPTWAPWWRLSAPLEPGRDALAAAFDALGEVSWDLAKPARDASGPEPGTLRMAPASDAGRCDSANLSR